MYSYVKDIVCPVYGQFKHIVVNYIIQKKFILYRQTDVGFDVFATFFFHITLNA